MKTLRPRVISTSFADVGVSPAGLNVAVDIIAPSSAPALPTSASLDTLMRFAAMGGQDGVGVSDDELHRYFLNNGLEVKPKTSETEPKADPVSEP